MLKVANFYSVKTVTESSRLTYGDEWAGYMSYATVTSWTPWREEVNLLFLCVSRKKDKLKHFLWENTP
jgi:hypothetical protein